jgi:putative Holliday junction resolvase
MRFLCIDLGDKRTGLAICDGDEILASPLAVSEGRKKLLDEIIEIARQNQVEGLVFGLPLNMDNSEGQRAIQTRKFADQIKDKINLPIFFQDERLSSFTAEKQLSQTGLTHKKKKDRIDALAAAEILKTFIEERKQKP